MKFFFATLANMGCDCIDQGLFDVCCGSYDLVLGEQEQDWDEPLDYEEDYEWDSWDDRWDPEDWSPLDEPVDVPKVATAAGPFSDMLARVMSMSLEDWKLERFERPPVRSLKSGLIPRSEFRLRIKATSWKAHRKSQYRPVSA